MRHTAKPQWCEYGERRFYARSRAEAAHAAVLEMQRKAGVIADWRHEPRRYTFPDRTRAPLFYLPDFEVTALDGFTFMVEVKGHWQSRDRERIRLMARHYPDVVIRFVGAPIDSAFQKRIDAARAKALAERAKAERKAARVKR